MITKTTKLSMLADAMARLISEDQIGFYEASACPTTAMKGIVTDLTFSAPTRSGIKFHGTLTWGTVWDGVAYARHLQFKGILRGAEDMGVHWANRESRYLSYKICGLKFMLTGYMARMRRKAH